MIAACIAYAVLGTAGVAVAIDPHLLRTGRFDRRNRLDLTATVARLDAVEERERRRHRVA